MVNVGPTHNKNKPYTSLVVENVAMENMVDVPGIQLAMIYYKRVGDIIVVMISNNQITIRIII